MTRARAALGAAVAAVVDRLAADGVRLPPDVREWREQFGSPDQPRDERGRWTDAGGGGGGDKPGLTPEQDRAARDALAGYIPRGAIIGADRPEYVESLADSNWYYLSLRPNWPGSGLAEEAGADAVFTGKEGRILFTREPLSMETVIKYDLVPGMGQTRANLIIDYSERQYMSIRADGVYSLIEMGQTTRGVLIHKSTSGVAGDEIQATRWVEGVGLTGHQVYPDIRAAMKDVTESNHKLMPNDPADFDEYYFPTFPKSNYSATFAAQPRGSNRPGRKPPVTQAVNDYEDELEELYDEWADELAGDLARADDDKADGIIAAAIAALLLSLQGAGHRALPGVALLGAGDKGLAGSLLEAVTGAVSANDAYLQDSLMPAIQARIDYVRQGASWAEAAASAGDRRVIIRAELEGMASRVESYAGQAWALGQKAVGYGSDGRIAWRKDPQAHHCATCLQYGDREYESYDAMLEETGGVTPGDGTDCQSGCRCWLEPVE